MASLADSVLEVVEDFGVPVPTGVVRVVVSARRGEPVAAEALSRMAAAQRESFERTRTPPRLSEVIDKDARPTRPRVWAAGEWRLARRIITPDVIDGWRAGLALAMCNEMLKGGQSEPTARVALEAVSAVVGAVASYVPGSTDEWVRFRKLVAAHLPGPGLAMHTVEQGEAEARLRDHVPPLPGTALYFGLREDFALVPDVRDPELLGLPRDGEEGLPFDRVAWRRLGGDERALRLVLGYLQSYSHLMDDLGRPPTSEEFANRWRFSLESVRDDEALFRQAFPEEDNPERILRLLDRALPRAGAMARLMGVRVTDRSPTPPDPLGSRSLVSGQRWRSPDGASFISVIESVDGDSFVGAQHDQDSGSSVLVTGTRETLAGWRLDIPGGVWRVSFDVQQAAPDLLDRLSTAGVVVNRLARPGDPRPGRGLPSASVEVLIDGADENDARTRVFRAMHGLGLVDTETLYIRPVG